MSKLLKMKDKIHGRALGVAAVALVSAVAVARRQRRGKVASALANRRRAADGGGREARCFM